MGQMWKSRELLSTHSYTHLFWPRLRNKSEIINTILDRNIVRKLSSFISFRGSCCAAIFIIICIPRDGDDSNVVSSELHIESQFHNSSNAFAHILDLSSISRARLSHFALHKNKHTHKILCTIIYNTLFHGFLSAIIFGLEWMPNPFSNLYRIKCI